MRNSTGNGYFGPSPTVGHHDFSQLVLVIPGLAEIEKDCRMVRMTNANLHDWFGAVEDFALHLPACQQVTVVGHLGRLIDDNADASGCW